MSKRVSRILIISVLASSAWRSVGAAESSASDDSVILTIPDRASSELVIAGVDFSGVLARQNVDPRQLRRLRAFTMPDDQEVPAQFVPGVPAAGETTVRERSARGMLILKLPAGCGPAVRLRFDGPAPVTDVAFDGHVSESDFGVSHAAGRMGGLPYQITFPKSGKLFSEFAWNDRVYHEQLGGFLLRNDDHAQVEMVSCGPLCTVVGAWARYVKADGSQPPSHPRAVYHWHYFHDLPVVLVTAAVSQEQEYAWREVHFLELNFPGSDFTRWSGAQPLESGDLAADGVSHRYSNWALLSDGANGIGMFGGGRILVYDGRGGYGTYLHADGDRAWEPWEGRQRHFAGWLWMGTESAAQDAVRAWSARLPLIVPSVVSPGSVHSAIEEARRAADTLAGSERATRLWQVACARRLEAEGRFDAARSAAAGQLPGDWKEIVAGDLRLAVNVAGGGMELKSLFDARSEHEHLPVNPLPLFEITLRDAESRQTAKLAADQGWRDVAFRAVDSGGCQILWSHPANESLGAMTVMASVRPRPETSALHWQLEVSGQRAPWSLWRVKFPQLELAAPGEDPALLFPRGPGEVQRDVWSQAFAYQGLYPNGWTSMQFLAVYDRTARRGLYVALHDPLGCVKDLSATARQSAATLVLAAEHPVENMGRPGNRFLLSGDAVWQAFDGDWFDASILYRNWVRHEARWFPALSSQGRDDTPMWMRELCIWAQTGGAAGDCVEPVRKFGQYIGLPTGFHWYSWHQIPFDNDYPHYFPAKEGFEEAVEQLRASQVYVMPYINGRLWDTRDRGVEDFEFSSRALPAATKDEAGEPFTEVYGSKERDGSPVRLAVMCPSTPVWQHEVASIVGRLFQACRVNGVYIDQIAAAAPKLCMDARHGHPLGGGSWWNAGYAAMLESLRGTKPADGMLTSECNAEPFMRWFDGYLTWHWQHDGQVPAFPAVYGGAIQMFGRAYRGGDTKDLALRMKAGQQLVYGEQIGWIHPGVIDEAENGPFLRDIVQLRWHLRRYFYAGQMLRPPVLAGTVPRVRADWQWQENWWVSTDAVLTGAWSQPHEHRVAAIFVNVSDQPVTADWEFDASSGGIAGETVLIARLTSEGKESAVPSPASFRKTLSLAPRTAVAFEFTPIAD